jgi:phospholipase/lecithinase/hemolysin
MAPRKAARVVTLLLGACVATGAGRTAIAQVAAGTSSGLAPAPARAAPATATDLFVLGDSLSDIGNAASLADYALAQPFYPNATVGFCNPVDVFLLGDGCDAVIYRRTRASNGPVAVEALAAGLGLPPLEPSFHILPTRPVHGTDYAVAGGTAGGSGVDDLASQIDALRLDRGPELPAGALYVLIIGGNDGLAALRAAAEESVGLVPTAAGDATVDAAVRAIGDAVDVLVGSGARRLLVANLPNLAAVPALRDRASSLGLDEAAARALAVDITARFNAALAARLASAAAAHPEARIEAFDLFAAMEEARLAAAAAGEDVTDACFDSEAYRESPFAERRFAPDCAPLSADGAPRFDRFFFWDSLHPTSATHAALGAALLDFIAATLGDEVAVPAAAVPLAPSEPSADAARPPAAPSAHLPPLSPAPPVGSVLPPPAPAIEWVRCYASIACVSDSTLFFSH